MHDCERVAGHRVQIGDPREERERRERERYRRPEAELGTLLP